jgi:hypothetical protein
MPFGLCNVPATYQRLVITAFQEYMHKFIELFLDDFCVFSTKVNHADYSAKCFAKYHEYEISLNAAKSQFLVPYEKLLGHIVSAQGMATDPDKVAVPNTVSEVKGFLGHTGYYRRYIYKYATLALPLTQLLKKSELPPVWTPNCTKAFHILKQKLVSAPILVPPNWDKDFDVYVDASNVAIGSILSQKDDSQHDHPIYFASHQLNAA